MIKQLCFPLMLTLMPTVAAFAGEKPITLEQMVVTATRSEDKITTIPAKVEVIDSWELERTAGETLTEQLKKNSSIGVVEYPGTLAGIGIRGFRPEFSGITKHSLVLINGRPAGATNLATILTDDIERIEVLKGPASSLYGGEAMGGVVNIITRKNRGELTGMAEIGVGSFRSNNQKMAVGGAVGSGFDFDLSARRFEQADDFKMGNGKIRANTSYKTQSGGLRIGKAFLDTWRFDLNGNLYQGRDIETPGDIFYGDIRSGSRDIDRYGLDLTVVGNINEENRLSFTAYRTGEATENYKDYSGWPAVRVEPFRSYDSQTDWLGFQLKNEYSWRDHRFIIGADYQNITVESRDYNQDGSRKAPWSPNEGRENLAGYLETIWKFMDKRLTASLGGRYDTFTVETKTTPYKTDFTPNSEKFSTTSLRAGLNYLFDGGMRLHTTLGQGFVPPSAGQLAGYAETVVGGVTMVTKGNPNLDPESSLTFDLGVGYARPQWGLNLDLTFFHTDVVDKIVRVTTGTTTTYQNSLGAKMEGVETTFSFDIGAPLAWKRSLELFINATHMLKAEEEQTDGTMRDIHNVARHTINYGVRYEDGMFDAKLHLRNQGRMKDTDWNAAGYPELEYPSFTVADLVVGIDFLTQHRLTLRADNLFNEDYYEKKGYPKPGRAFYATYRYEF